jgi:hypothetical protein
VADPLTQLMAALAREDELGNRVHALDDVRHAIPLIVLSAGLDVGKLSEGTQQLMLEVTLAAGLDPFADPAPTPEQIVEAFAQFYRDQPVDAAILEEIRKAFEAVDDGPPKAAQALLGQERSTGVLGGGERPKGTIPAALGRLQTSVPPRKKDR